MIKSVIFDIDGVLLDSFETNLRFYHDLMTYFGHRPPTREGYPALSHLSLWDSIREMTGLESEAEIKKIWEAGKSGKVRYPFELSRMPEEAETVIIALSQKYSLGIVTSRLEQSMFQTEEMKALEKYFKAAVSFEDTAKRKPDPEPLLLAAKKLNIKPEEAVYIGDAESDLGAARAAGMKAIIYSKNIPGADAWTLSFGELPELIKAL